MQIAQASSGTPGRKNVICVGVGFPQLLLDDVSGSKEEEITKAAIRATDEMLKARVTLNVIDPTAMADSSLDMNNPEYLNPGTLHASLGPTSDKVSGILNFDTFAPATGGHLFVGSNDVQGEINQAVDNGANYYTISYAPSNHSDEATRFRNMSVVMRNPSLTASTRTGYFLKAKVDPNVAPAPPTVHDLTFDLISAALSSITYNGVYAEATQSGRKLEQGYVLHTRLSDLMPHVLRNGSNVVEVTVMEVCFGAKNKVLSHDVHEISSRIVQDGAPLADVDFVVPSAPTPRGTVRLRFVIRDAISGHMGTVDVPNP